MYCSFIIMLGQTFTHFSCTLDNKFILLAAVLADCYYAAAVVIIGIVFTVVSLSCLMGESLLRNHLHVYTYLGLLYANTNTNCCIQTRDEGPGLGMRLGPGYMYGAKKSSSYTISQCSSRYTHKIVPQYVEQF